MTSFDWLAAVYDTAVFTAFDTETTGLDHQTGRVVEIGAVQFDMRGIIARYNVLINPQMAMPEDAQKVNGITDEMLSDKPIFIQVEPDFSCFIQGSVLVAHNAPFDVHYINTELQRIGLPLLSNKVVDTRIFTKELYPGLQSYALQDLAMQFGIQALEAHRAEDDARVCMELFMCMLTQFLKKDPGLIKKIRSEFSAAEVLAVEKVEKDYAQRLF
ncbi:MAG: 3'-5' exonuclease [Treponema sp.]